jgi:hypothetical protein
MARKKEDEKTKLDMGVQIVIGVAVFMGFLVLGRHLFLVRPSTRHSRNQQQQQKRQLPQCPCLSKYVPKPKSTSFVSKPKSRLSSHQKKLIPRPSTI